MWAVIGHAAFLLITLGIAVWFQWLKVAETLDEPDEPSEVTWLKDLLTRVEPRR